MLYLSLLTFAWFEEIGRPLLYCHTASVAHSSEHSWLPHLGWAALSRLLADLGWPRGGVGGGVGGGAAMVTQCCLPCCSFSSWVQEGSPEMLFSCQRWKHKRASRITPGLLRPRLQAGTPWLLPQQVSWSRKIYSLGGKGGLQTHVTRGMGGGRREEWEPLIPSSTTMGSKTSAQS